MATAENRPRSGQTSGTLAIVGALSFGLFVLHMIFNGRYGYFRDELY